MPGPDALIEHVVAKYGPQSVEQLIQNHQSRAAFRAERKSTFVCGPGFAGHIHQDGEKVIHLPGGGKVLVSTDASGHATHVEEAECLHAIVRPDTYRPKTRMSA